MLKERLAKLIDVKSIVTIGLTVVFIVLAIRGVIPTEFMTVYTMVLTYYFTRKKGTDNGNVTEGAD